MGFFRVFIMPFDENGVYTEFQEVTKYIEKNGVGNLETSIDSSDYLIGVFRVSRLSLKLNNRSGIFSDVGSPESMFQYTRADSRIKITYQPWETKPIAGFAKCGVVGSATFWEESVVFEGLLSDDDLKAQLKGDTIEFSVFGKESVFSRAIVPFGTIHNGQALSTIIYSCLNQPDITALLEIDPANITVGLDQNIDSIASLQHKTVKEGMDKMLLATNSVLYVLNDKVYITPRTPTPDVRRVFYGQASSLGPENIQDLKDIKTGLSRTFNFFAWKSGPAVTQSDSAVKHRARKAGEIDLEFILDNTKRTNILNNLLSEFAWPKRELSIVSPLTQEHLGINLLDRVTIDYPTVYIEADNPLPISGTVAWDEAVLPDAQWSFSFDEGTPFKVISKRVNVNDLTVEFRLREI